MYKGHCGVPFHGRHDTLKEKQDHGYGKDQWSINNRLTYTSFFCVRLQR